MDKLAFQKRTIRCDRSDLRNNEPRFAILCSDNIIYKHTYCSLASISWHTIHSYWLRLLILQKKVQWSSTSLYLGHMGAVVIIIK